jgi:outer membrane protein assembly factor BamB
MLRREFTPGPGSRVGHRPLIILIGALTLLLAATACGSSAKSTPPAATATPTAPAQAPSALYAIATTFGSAGPTGVTVSALGLGNGTPLWQGQFNASDISAAGGGGTLYLDKGQLGNSATSQSTLEAVNASSGAELWHHPPTAGFGEPLAASNTTAFAFVVSLANPQAQPTEALTALRASDGTTLWSAPLSDALSGIPMWTLGSGALYVVASPTPTSPTQTFTMFAFNTSTGAELWHVSLQGAPTGHNTLLLSNGTLYFGEDTSTPSGAMAVVQAVRASDGATLWHTAPVAGFINDLVVSGGTVCYSYSLGNGPGGAIVALHASDGSPSWQVPVQGNGEPSLAADGSAIYAVTSTTSKTTSMFGVTTTLLVFDASSGRSLLHQPFPSLPVQAQFAQGSGPQPKVVGGVLYVVGQAVSTGPGTSPTSQSIVVALNTHDGSLAWQRQIPGYIGQVVFAAP